MFAWKLFLILAIIAIEEAISFMPLTLEETCVPTTVVKGLCHTCICGADGVFQCTKQSCIPQPKYLRSSIKVLKECEPDMAYRDDNVICSCTNDGRWKVGHCRVRFGHLKAKISLPIRINKINRTCTPDDLYLIDCNVCRCSDDGLIKPALCTNRRCTGRNKVETCSFGDILRTPDELCSCSDINVYIDRLCLRVKDEKQQLINETELAAILPEDVASTRSGGNRDECVPTDPPTTLRIDCNTCFCTKSKTLACTDKMCIGPKIHRKNSDSFFELSNLTKMKEADKKCVPGTKYRMSCNKCTCSPKGVPICTTMFCLEDFII